MAKAGYAAVTEGEVSLLAATAKTVLAVIAPAQFGIDLKGFSVSFDGVTAANEPVLIEVVKFTTDGTGTAATVQQLYGRTITAGFTAKRDYSAEPTVPTVLDELSLDPNKGTFYYDVPLGESIDTAVSELIGLRMNAPQAVNVRARLRFERT
jgi:hypothetical protein